MKHFTWTYEVAESYYHIYPCSKNGERVNEFSICLNLEKSKFNDALVQDIVYNLEWLADGEKNV